MQCSLLSRSARSSRPKRLEIPSSDGPIARPPSWHAASAALTKDALRVIAASAPEPVAQSDIVKGLTAMGYQATDATAKAMLDGLDALSSVAGDGVLKKVREAGAKAAYEMNAAVAKQVLKGLRPKK